MEVEKPEISETFLYWSHSLATKQKQKKKKKKMTKAKRREYTSHAKENYTYSRASMSDCVNN